MKLNIKVIPGAKQNLFKIEGEMIKIYLTARPIEGKANQALIEFLAGHFKISKLHISIIKGLKSSYKVININGL